MVADLFTWAEKHEPGRLECAFLRFHAENPRVLERMLELCRQLRARGFRRYSTRTIVAVLRFERDLETGGEDVYVEGDPEPRRVKLNDHHSAYYARLIMDAYPEEFADFFETRRCEKDGG